MPFDIKLVTKDLRGSHKCTEIIEHHALRRIKTIIGEPGLDEMNCQGFGLLPLPRGKNFLSIGTRARFVRGVVEITIVRPKHSVQDLLFGSRISTAEDLVPSGAIE